MIGRTRREGDLRDTCDGIGKVMNKKSTTAPRSSVSSVRFGPRLAFVIRNGHSVGVEVRNGKRRKQIAWTRGCDCYSERTSGVCASLVLDATDTCPCIFRYYKSNRDERKTRNQTHARVRADRFCLFFNFPPWKIHREWKFEPGFTNKRLVLLNS